ncbi:MAG: mitofilin family membrane protein [Pseudomonadota bacterium]
MIDDEKTPGSKQDEPETNTHEANPKSDVTEDNEVREEAEGERPPSSDIVEPDAVTDLAEDLAPTEQSLVGETDATGIEPDSEASEVKVDPVGEEVEQKPQEDDQLAQDVEPKPKKPINPLLVGLTGFVATGAAIWAVMTFRPHDPVPVAPQTGPATEDASRLQKIVDPNTSTGAPTDPLNATQDDGVITLDIPTDEPEPVSNPFDKISNAQDPSVKDRASELEHDIQPHSGDEEPLSAKLPDAPSSDENANAGLQDAAKAFLDTRGSDDENPASDPLIDTNDGEAPLVENEDDDPDEGLGLGDTADAQASPEETGSDDDTIDTDTAEGELTDTPSDNETPEQEVSEPVEGSSMTDRPEETIDDDEPDTEDTGLFDAEVDSPSAVDPEGALDEPDTPQQGPDADDPISSITAEEDLAGANNDALLNQTNQLSEEVERLQAELDLKARELDQARYEFEETLNRTTEEQSSEQDALMARLSEKNGEIEDLEARLLQAEAAARTAREAAAAAPSRLLASREIINSLQAALIRGEPFEGELARLTSTLPDGTVSQSLSSLATVGAPTQLALTREFKQLTPKAIAADDLANANGALGRLIANIRSLITVRPATPIEGESVRAVISRAEAAVVNGDLERCVDELESLSPPAASIFAPWVADTTNLIEAKRSLARLEATVF